MFSDRRRPTEHVADADSPLSADDVKSLARRLGADDVGIARAAPVTTRELFTSWLVRGYVGEMGYLRRNSDVRFDPTKLLGGARSVIVTALNYCPTAGDRERPETPLKVGKYAWGEDYHRVLRRILRTLRQRLLALHPGLRGRICVDTAPFPDKYWAAMAGLGWQGKHTNLVSRSFGSWLLLGSLVIDVGVDAYDEPGADFCGNCRACLEACPTDAFPSPYLLDATRCISYWTIESRAPALPEYIASRLSGWVFGCDVCLDVCPWNKFQKARSHPAVARRDEISLLEAGRVGDMSESEFTDNFADTAIARARFPGMVRNTRTALGTTDSSRSPLPELPQA